ncbi:uncharacterized protein si:ch1073-291c23.2 [Morone saxatilis]|uniref:uncharacterized protein si:ch1073-291c23.2 n=1 Tax=Morone saxatilis TaxID=34816 RepID=UPI0015E248B1|nr:uncharacterized protein si:ch1073-291c23.2 [Morone saxatilis]XP_035507704.1 uncharacterized protein si:ch1073-291c23.2 [Morone saxatilis]
MSAELYSASGNNTSLQGATMGGVKPLHRFIKGQPKIIGIIVLVLGMSYFILSIAIMPSSVQHLSAVIPPGLLLGTMFIVCGILYIVTEHKPTKKTVTISLALSIVGILVACWTFMLILPELVHSHYYRHYDYFEYNITESEVPWLTYEAMDESMNAIFLFHSFVGAVILIVMSALAGAALRSTKSQVIVMMTASPTETPVE